MLIFFFIYLEFFILCNTFQVALGKYNTTKIDLEMFLSGNRFEIMVEKNRQDLRQKTLSVETADRLE